MVTAEMKEQVQVLERSPEELNLTAVQQVNDILAGAAKQSDKAQLAAKTWAYRIPFAGVRYYSYE